MRERAFIVMFIPPAGLRTTPSTDSEFGEGHHDNGRTPSTTSQNVSNASVTRNKYSARNIGGKVSGREPCS